MTLPAPETIEREKHKLWVTDAELIRRVGVPEKRMRDLLHELDSKNSGFPQKQRLWGDRRYWPAVRDYFDSKYGLRVEAPARRTANGR